MRTIYRDVLLVQKLLPDIREFSEYFTFPLSSKSSGLKNLGAHVMQEEVYKTKVHDVYRRTASADSAYGTNFIKFYNRCSNQSCMARASYTACAWRQKEEILNTTYDQQMKIMWSVIYSLYSYTYKVFHDLLKRASYYITYIVNCNDSRGSFFRSQCRRIITRVESFYRRGQSHQGKLQNKDI